MTVESSEKYLRKLGARIRGLREENGLTQEDFDDQSKLGITSVTTGRSQIDNESVITVNQAKAAITWFEAAHSHIQSTNLVSKVISRPN